MCDSEYNAPFSHLVFRNCTRYKLNKHMNSITPTLTLTFNATMSVSTDLSQWLNCKRVKLFIVFRCIIIRRENVPWNRIKHTHTQRRQIERTRERGKVIAKIKLSNFLNALPCSPAIVLDSKHHRSIPPNKIYNLSMKMWLLRNCPHLAWLIYRC